MIDQLMILLTGVVAVSLSQTRTLVRWACIFGLIGQPFWLYATWHAGQWGIFVNSVLYTVAWAYGFYVHWVKR